MRPKRPTPHPLLAYMSYPSRHEAVAIAIAAIGVGMFIGTWVIGPAIPQGNIERAAETTGAPSFEEMVSRPDPNPYRSATPQFDMSGAPKYGEAARQAALEGRSSGDDAYAQEQTQSLPRWSGRVRRFDRHTGVMY